MVQSITVRRPDGMHLHLRDDAMLRTVLPYSVRQFGRAMVMPNLKPPVTTVAAGRAYRQRILDALPAPDLLSQASARPGERKPAASA